MNNKEYPKGIYWNKRHEESPDFILGKITIDRDKAIEWLRNKEGQYINLQLLKPLKPEDIPYLMVDNYKKQADFDKNLKDNKEINIQNDIPF